METDERRPAKMEAPFAAHPRRSTDQEESMTKGARLRRAVFWIGTPMAILALLARRREVVLYMGGNVPIVGRPRSWLPSVAADILFLYSATIAAVAVLAVVVVMERQRMRAGGAARMTLSASFLPAYVAGIEATDHVRWALRSGPMGAYPSLLEHFARHSLACGVGVGAAVAIGILAGLVLGYPRREWILNGAPVCAMVASVSAPWVALIALARPWV